MSNGYQKQICIDGGERKIKRNETKARIISYRILGIFFTIITLGMLVGCFSPSKPYEKKYDTVELLQVAFPDFYYFDLDLDNKTIYNGCYAISHDYSGSGCARKHENDIDYCGYRINYNFDNSHSGDDSIRITCDAKSSFEDIYYRGGENEIVSNLTFDNIQCKFIYYISGHVIIDITFYFEIDNVLYRFYYGNVSIEYKDEYLEWCVDIAESGIINRYKPNQQLALYTIGALTSVSR